MTERVSLERHGYVWHEKQQVWIRPDFTGIAYSDGDETEQRLAGIIGQVQDVSVLSEEWRRYCTNWPLTYHLSEKRANILRPFEENLHGDILEIGAGCGAITRYLGECGGNVLALEGSFRRAAMARSRTRDLQNVTVVCEKFDRFRIDRQFDVVTLIGVLEYAGLFTQGENPVQNMLACVRSLVKPDGWLIIAIENQLGLKYFAGAPEDHLGRAMYGIEGRYRSGQPQTFGRPVLRNLLTEAGFASVDFLAPFPDYKLPVSIVTENGASAKDFDAAAFAVQSVRLDPQLPASLSFAPELVWPTLAQNGLLLDLSNSFLVVAGKNNTSILDSSSLAWHFTTSRKKSFCKAAHFQRMKAGDIEVHYRRLDPEPYVPLDNERLEFILPEKDRYVYGRLLSEEFIHIVSRNDDWSMDDIVVFLKKYIDILCQTGDSSQQIVRIDGADSELPGSFLDFIPRNIVVTGDGQYFIIDKEWKYNGILSAGFLLFRALMYSTQLTPRLFENPVNFICSVFAALGWPTTANTIQRYYRLEMAILAEAAGAPCSWQDCDRYKRWQNARALDDLDARIFQEHVSALWKKRLLFEFCFVLKPETEALLADSIDAIQEQYYDGWRLSIFARTPAPEEAFTREGNPVRWRQIPEHIAPEDFIDEHLLQTPAHWVGFFECGTRFAPQLLLLLSDYLAIHPEWRAIYTDEDTVDANGERQSPAFKPDFNLELLRSADYIGSLFADRNTLLAAGGYSIIPDAANFDGALRLADAGGDSAIGHIPDVLIHVPPTVSARAAEGGAVQALREHLVRRGIAGEVSQGLAEGVTRRVVYQHSGTPLVSIIVPTRNRPELLQPCVESLLQQTRYPHWELLLVDNGSDDPAVLAYYDTLRARHAERIRVLRFDAPFNFSAMNNRAAREARGDYLLLLNNDTECIHDDWLDAMMAHARRPDVGIVGARLLFPGSLKVQHAGVVLGLTGTAGHVFIESLSHDEPGYLNRALADQEYSAVTGACLLIRRSLFAQIGGLDEQNFMVSFNDVDLCLKVRQLGYRILWTPFATLLHHCSATQFEGDSDAAKIAAFQREADAFYQRWSGALDNDPAWNPNLSLTATNPTVDDELAVPWRREFHDRPRIAVMPMTSAAAAESRCIVALRALRAAGKVHYAVCERMPTSVELARMAPDVLLTRAPPDDALCQALLRYQRFNPGILRVYLLDELSHSPEQIASGLAASHRLIVSTEAQAEAWRPLIDDIRLAPNAEPDALAPASPVCRQTGDGGAAALDLWLKALLP
ncbi:MAG: glycosyltransferase [Candidatus Accumulibacter sp.]|jgi:GT2 family glycosyltransferase/SAM-dependent methyltransferase|nr:glycosyltransferase [Accumulibacter sp.]